MGLSPFPVLMKLRGALGLPALTKTERALFKKVLMSLRSDSTLEIFEYGSGFSTIYFAEFLRKDRLPFHICSAENNLGWHQKVQRVIKTKKLDGFIASYLFEFPSFWEKEEWDWEKVPQCGQFAPSSKEEFEYIQLPLSLGRKFDLIFIDGRFRRRCLELAPQCLKKGGIVYLHDAQKDHYQQPLSAYKYSRFIKTGRFYPLDKINWQVWLGSIDNPIIQDL